MTISRDPLTWQYPKLEANQSGRLRVSSLHEIYFEESGNPRGKPVVFVHGGPGGGTEPNHRRFFNPQLYRIILFDQRGCGQSTPHACLDENTTWDLVEDMEKLRKHLAVDRWQVFGGSWGSTLALAYAQKHPQVVTELVLRGIFLLRKQEINWFYQFGASEIYPDAWEPYRDAIPEGERHDFLRAYYKRLTSSEPAVRLAAARAWSLWEGRTSRLLPEASSDDHFGAEDFALAFARIECHYFTNKGFFPEDGYLLKHIDAIRKIPAVIVHGRYDVVCPLTSAWDLHRAWPEAELFITPDAGHAAIEPANCRALVAATDRFVEP